MNWTIQRLALAAALGLTLAACGGDSGSDGGATPQPNEPEEPETPVEPEPEPEPTVLERVRFLTIGDSGSGSDGAYAVGQAMADICAVKLGAENDPERAGCDFVVGLGDNIYESGVTSVDDPQFEEKFELPFEPVDLPFYLVLGNHDNTAYVGGDGAGNARGEFQVDYTYFDGRLSDRWIMPDRYFQQDAGETASGAPLVSLFALDSNPIAGGFADADLDYAYHTYGINQLNWAVSAIGGSQAEFKIGLAHHPYLSNGTHGNAGNYDGVPSQILPVLAGDRWRAFMEEAVCDKTDFFFAGHDHDLQVLDAVPECGRTEFVVSGAASKTRSLDDPERNQAPFQIGDVYGFFWMEAVEADSQAGTPARLCLEAYVVEPGVDGLGVLDAGQATPAYKRCYDKQPAAGIPASNDFSSDIFTSGEAFPLPLPDGFDADFSGPLQAFRDQLISGFNQAMAGLPEGPQQEVAAQILAGLDTLFSALDGAAAAISGGDDADMSQAFQGALAASQQLEAIDTSVLPAPFDQLGGAFQALSEGFGNSADFEGESSGTLQDVAFLAGPLVQLARNLDNIVDGVDEQTPDVPVLSGLTKVLSSVSLGLANTLEQLVLLDTSATGEQLVGTIQLVLEQVVNDVLWLESVDQATLPGNLVSTALAFLTREVTEQLDRGLSPLSGLLDLLSPVTNLLSGLLGFL